MTIPKDFKRWHTQKEMIHEKHPRVYFHEREIWFCAVGANIGFEQDGSGVSFLRPVVIVRKFNNEVCWIVPLTKTSKIGKYYFKFSFDDSGESSAILSQIRLIDAKRLKYKAGNMKPEDFTMLKESMRGLL